LVYSTLIVDKFHINSFDHLAQVVLDTTIISLTDFRLALNIPIGITSSILKYAKGDIEAICAGKLHFPQENNNPSNDDGVEYLIHSFSSFSFSFCAMREEEDSRSASLKLNVKAQNVSII
jgi:hypothetical protein